MTKPRARPRTEELQRLVHELRVQQLALERQNEEICHAQRELEVERDRVADLYQLAPVAHLTLDPAGTIVEATVLAVALLGVDRRRLTRRRLHELVVPTDWATLSRISQTVFAAPARPCDLGILRSRPRDGPGSTWCRCRRASTRAGRPSWNHRAQAGE